MKRPAAAGDAAPLLRVADALAAARAAGVARLDAQLLLSHHLDRDRAWLLAHDDAPIARVIADAVRTEIARRSAGEPLAYITGVRHFCGLKLQVCDDVLVPRPETELLVEWALERLAARESMPATVLDLGTGSGAIALAVKQSRADTTVCATDASAAALAVARANAARCGLAVEWVQGSWWTPLEHRRFDLVLSNPPYIAVDDPHLAALHHEPRAALASGADGLSALRTIVATAAAHLNSGAWLLLEHGHDQAGAVRALLSDRGFRGVQTRVDLAGFDRCTGACWLP